MTTRTPPDAIQRPHSRLPVSTVGKTRMRPMSEFNPSSDFRASSYGAPLESHGKHILGESHSLTRPSTTLNAKLESIRDKRRSTHSRSVSLSAAPTSLEQSNSFRNRTDAQAARQPASSMRPQSSMSQNGSRMEGETPRVLKPFSENRIGALTTADERTSSCPMTRSKTFTEKSSTTTSSIAHRYDTPPYGTPSSTIPKHSSPLRHPPSASKRPVQETLMKSDRSSTLASTARQLVSPPSMIGSPSTRISTALKKPARSISRLATPSTITRPISSLSIASTSPTTVTQRTASSSATATTKMPPPTTRCVATATRQVAALSNVGNVTTNHASRSITRPMSSLSRLKQTPSRIMRPLSVTAEALPPRKILRSIKTSSRATEKLMTVHTPERAPPVQSAQKRLMRMASEKVKSSSFGTVTEISSPVACGTAQAEAISLNLKERRQTLTRHDRTTEGSAMICDKSGDYYQKVIDPLDPKGRNKFSNNLHRRIQEARKTGTLQLSKLGLSNVPDVVYELLQNGHQNGVSYSKPKSIRELTAFVATHNSIERIDGLFPDVFSCLVSVDLRHNGLRKIPLSMNKLYSLNVLNLSSNKLTNESLSVLFTISSLLDLDIQANRFDGEIPSCLCNLVSLEALNVNDNEFSSVAETAFTALCHLQKLNVKSNKLRTFPFGSIENAPIVELDLSYNKISESLISIDRISRFSELRVLRASHNQIKVVSDFAIMLPYLEELDLNSNMVVSLGMLLLCTPSLVQLHISRNMIPVLPDGITELRNLKMLDISYNLFRHFDSRIGLIDSLESLRWDGNKFVERSLAALDTKNLKMRLRERYEKEMSAKEQQDEHDIGDELLEMAVQKRLTRSQSKSKQLDLSGRGYSDLPDRLVERYMPGQYNRYGTVAITELHLQRNEFSTIPDTIMSFAFADALRSINLSHNNLGEDAFVSPISLRSLSELNLACNSINSLIMFVANFQLQSLQKLDLSFNKVHHVPLNLVMAFSTLEELNLHENKISEIDADAFKGLEKIDLSNNSIRYLPPELGKIKTIVTLKVHGNTFKTPRWQIVQKGTDALMQWLRLRLPEEDDGPESK
ncbi:hypothetical protein V1508DRAFT_373024 [Lipomyces doorenjongii]|uniref:uncharacterized protein n=1 Tax=Lipomyces doorenjongii TaxID=383834 RepID=UPI0034CFD615